MRFKPWAQLPAKWVADGILSEAFKWGSGPTANGASSIAALQLLIVLATHAEPFGEKDRRVASPTYNDLMLAAGLSRKLVFSGLALLSEAGLLQIHRDGRKNTYFLTGFEGYWCKFPAKALYTGDKILPFHRFHKRAICELHAMKLLIYYATIRDRNTAFSQASFETIYKRTGVIEKAIPTANGVLLNAGLLTRVGQENSEGSKFREPNKYYLVGYKDLFT